MARETDSRTNTTEEKKEMEELKEGNEKRKVNVEMQEDCILLRLLCAQSHSLSNGPHLIFWVEACLCCLSDRTSSQTSEDKF